MSKSWACFSKLRDSTLSDEPFTQKARWLVRFPSQWWIRHWWTVAPMHLTHILSLLSYMIGQYERCGGVVEVRQCFNGGDVAGLEGESGENWVNMFKQVRMMIVYMSGTLPRYRMYNLHSWDSWQIDDNHSTHYHLCWQLVGQMHDVGQKNS